MNIEEEGADLRFADEYLEKVRDDVKAQADLLGHECREYHKKMILELEAQSDYNIFHQEIREQFDQALPDIQLKIQRVYKDITGGGDISIEKINDYGYDLEGLSLLVRPPFSCYMRKEALSGGQKTLIALAVVFGLHFHRPAPFFLLDEVDANLDRSNVQLIGRYLSKIESTQIIQITHRKEGIEYAPHFIFVQSIVLGPLKSGVRAHHYTYEEALQIKDNRLLQLQGLKKNWQRQSKMLNQSQHHDTQAYEAKIQIQNRALRGLMKIQEIIQGQNNENKQPDNGQFIFYAADVYGRRKSFEVRGSGSRTLLEKRQRPVPPKVTGRKQSPFKKPVQGGRLSQILEQSQDRISKQREQESSDSDT